MLFENLSVTGPDGDVTSYSYDPAGNRTGLMYPNGTSTAYSYDINNRLIALSHADTVGQVMASYAYTLGPIGNRTRIDELVGVSREYSYDNLYRLTDEKVTVPLGEGSYQNSFTYDAVGNRLMLAKLIGLEAVSTEYAYNDADQLVTEGGNTYAYDLNGNLISKTGPDGTTVAYSYDYENRLVGFSSPQGEISYAYDADGNRVASVTPSGETRYLVDANRGLPQVLAEYTPEGTINASYVYADDLISMTRNSGTYYYLFDGLGSTRMLTDANGDITDTYTYDAFGNLIASTGTTENSFLFTGQQYDANAGFYYLRARYYQPDTGRFLTTDPYSGDIYAPMTLHRYLYAGNDPLNKVDPSGKFFGLTAITISLSIISVLTFISIPTYSWAQSDSSACKEGRAPNGFERAVLESIFSGLKENGFRITGERSPKYNCIAWSVGETHHWLWQEVDSDKGNNNGIVEIVDFDMLYKSKGLVVTDNIKEAQVMLYALGDRPTHAARRHSCNAGGKLWFESKLGPQWRIIHEANGLNGSEYGRPIKYYK